MNVLILQWSVFYVSVCLYNKQLKNDLVQDSTYKLFLHRYNIIKIHRQAFILYIYLLKVQILTKWHTLMMNNNVIDVTMNYFVKIHKHYFLGLKTFTYILKLMVCIMQWYYQHIIMLIFRSVVRYYIYIISMNHEE